MIACFVTSDDLELFIKAVRLVTLDNGFNLATKNAQRARLTVERLLKIRKSKGDYHKYNIQCNTATLVLQVYNYTEHHHLCCHFAVRVPQASSPSGLLLRNRHSESNLVIFNVWLTWPK